MKFKLVILASCLLIAAGGYGGLRIGMIVQQRLDEKHAVEADAAHWDTHTREFKYGSAEASFLVNSRVSEVMDDARLPARKPHHD